MEVTNFNFISHTIPKIIIKNNPYQTLNFLIIPNEDIDFNLDIILNEQETKNVHIGIYNYQKYKINCNVNVQYLKQHNNCSVNVIVLGADKSQSNVNISATVLTENNKIDQNIKGFLLSHQASISGLPTLNIETNEIVATHGLAIGSLNKEQMFYLMTKGFDQNQVKQILLLSQFETLLQDCNQEDKQFYLEKINNLWSNNNDKY